MDSIRKYFPGLTDGQKQRFAQLRNLYEEWNSMINVISRKDMENLYQRHVLHSLAIARFISFAKGTTVLDAGTGGGFPGIPLAVFFPEVKFHLVDATGKKVRVVEAISKSLQLANVTAQQCRVEELTGQYDFIVSRAVAPMKTIREWTQHLLSAQSRNVMANGWLLLKGGDLSDEINELNRPVVQHPVDHDFSEPFFQGKFVVYFS